MNWAEAESEFKRALALGFAGLNPKEAEVYPSGKAAGRQMLTEFLFSYGTLQLEAVQLATFGRRLTGKPDVLPGFEETSLIIEDAYVISISGKDRHTIARFTGRTSDTISGTVYALTPEEIQGADKYEVDACQRVSVLLQSGIRAWVYVDARYPPHTSSLSTR